MRRLLILMTVVFLLNAYDAGTHVFGAVPMQATQEMPEHMDCCPHKSVPAKSATTSCHYCCSGLFERTYSGSFVSITLWVDYAQEWQSRVKEGVSTKLFRPPRPLDVAFVFINI